MIISIAEAARQIEVDRRYLRGLIDGMGVWPVQVGSALGLTPVDFRRLAARAKARRRKERQHELSQP